ncbi:MAG: 5'-methylthioadenosine/adenosylhomocysteine nucleosidase [Ruthenibacterium sp.]
MQTIGILGAMPDEIAQLDAALTNRSETLLGGNTFYEGELAGRHVVLVCAGMGKVNAAAAAQLLITSFGASALVFSGIAGNMTDQIGVGDIVISREAVYHDAENRMIAETYPHLESFSADAALIAAAQRACRDIGTKYIVGKIATGDQFVGDSAVKKCIQQRCSPDCVEMEGAAVAHVAAKNDVPFVILRTMSDDADETAYDALVGKPFDIREYCDTAARICEALVRDLDF